MNPFGFLIICIGGMYAVWPYKLSKFSEQLDAIGSKRSAADVEPADWKVLLTRIIGTALFGVGVWMVLFG